MTPAKRTTSADVARVAGVSRTTVSYVLNNRPGEVIPEDTRRRVLEAAERLAYRPRASARTLAGGRSDIVVLSIPDLPIGPSISRFVEELATSLAKHGLTLFTHLMSAHGRPLADVCATVEAAAVLGFGSFEPETVAALQRLGVAMVEPVDADYNASMGPIGRLQAEHLIERGHRRLGYALPAEPGFRQMAEGRLRGAAAACAAAGLPAPVALIADPEAADAEQAVSQWRELSVTGVCAFNDEVAFAVLAGLRQAGLGAPQDMAVIGADDIPTARFATPPLSTVSIDLAEAGRHRAEQVVTGLAGERVDLSSALVKVALVHRATS
ncbi:LacI family DNA-binding transcriptional regulator [Actinospica durhamensis]|uniref:LacI family DNA-binding transcriptional regulator n=1 Tax=Actinospica durhamensis TaxID=1508375 RepID=A0A941IQ33_9ACTN|nr:LacI family DNA-binding transcriptional regulator [Actinospica durhamensis]MBR7833772.1 LacI family DNA-binding transcriptional regulator [Actinospica durhamensis]